MCVHRVGLETPKIEVQFDNLSVEGEVHIGSRALPTLLNSTLNAIEVKFLTIHWMFKNVCHIAERQLRRKYHFRKVCAEYL